MMGPIPEDDKKLLEMMMEFVDRGLPEEMMMELVHHGNWKEVVSLYEMYPDLRDKPLTGTNETTLHMAILVSNKEIVTMLLNVLKNADTRINMRDILTRPNDDGVTPVHLAVTVDMDEACLEMARLCPDVVTQARNKDGETILFQEVREGKKELFFALELLVQNALPNPPPDKMKRDVTHCWRSDGNNILHIAIYGEYFDLAYEIVYLYPKLVNYMNDRGESPLHYLANKPSRFRSGTSLNSLDQVIYSCIFIKSTETTETKFASIIPKYNEKEQAKNDEENPGEGKQVESSNFTEEKKRLPFPKINED